MQKNRLSRRERERLNQRREILDAALFLFSKKGYHNVSMHEIAKKAEFAVGTLYKFFKNKEDLYSSLIVEQSDKFHNAIIAAVRGSENEVEQLRNYVRAKSMVFRDNVDVIRLYFTETRGASFNVRTGLDKSIRQRYNNVLLNVLAPVFERGMKKKLFNRIAEPYQLAVALDSLCNAFLFLWLEEPDQNLYIEDPDIILNILFQGLMAS